jgi:NitT/TauT family transport system permease protein
MTFANQSKILAGTRIILFFAGALVIWELTGRLTDSMRFLVSTPTAALNYGLANYDELLSAFATTALESVSGLALAFVFAIATTIAGLYSTPLYRWMLPVAVVSQVIPIVSLAPFFIMVFGLGLSGKVAMAATMCFFPIFINFSAGIMGVEKSVRDLMFIYALSRTRSIFQVYIPLCVPSIFAGLRIASTLAVIGAIVAEFNGADRGLGKNLFLAAKRLEPELMVMSLLLSSFLGGVLYLTLNKIERRVGYWYARRRVFGL